MDSKFAKIIKEYQCCGCSKGYDVSCFESNPNGGIGCGNHYPGTIISGIGAIFLGMPKGFNRVGKHESLKPYIFESLKIALGLFCMAQKLFCFFTMQCWYCFDCCCHNLISYHYVNCQPVTKLTG